MFFNSCPQFHVAALLTSVICSLGYVKIAVAGDGLQRLKFLPLLSVLCGSGIASDISNSPYSELLSLSLEIFGLEDHWPWPRKCSP